MTLPDKQCSAYRPRPKTGQRVPDGLLTLSSTVGVNPGNLHADRVRNRRDTWQGRGIVTITLARGSQLQHASRRPPDRRPLARRQLVAGSLPPYLVGWLGYR